MKRLSLAALLFVLPAALHAQARKGDPIPAHAKVNQVRVDDAIKKGVKFLRLNVQAGLPEIDRTKEHSQRVHELILYTFVHAGVPDDDNDFQTLLKYVLKEKLERTYLVSLQSMALEDIDAAAYQVRIAQCAQFLVDNQAENGQWSYGGPIMMPEHLDVPTVPAKPRPVVTGKDEGKDDRTVRRTSTRPQRMIRITKRRRSIGNAGDNSNTQYAALGMRACADAGILFEPQVLKLAKSWWEKCQKGDGGWCYGAHPAHESYGSMSAGALGSLCIYNHLLKRSWDKDRYVKKGVEWITKNFTVTINPGKSEHTDDEKWMHFYFLYGLERAGVLFGTENFGKHEWYPEGAEVLLDIQETNGMWGKGVVDTCFAILFLRRATRPLLEDVESGTKKDHKKK